MYDFSVDRPIMQTIRSQYAQLRRGLQKLWYWHYHYHDDLHAAHEQRIAKIRDDFETERQLATALYQEHLAEAEVHHAEQIQTIGARWTAVRDSYP